MISQPFFLSWVSHAQRLQRAIRDVTWAMNALRRLKLTGSASEVCDATEAVDVSVAALLEVSVLIWVCQSY